MTQVNVESDSTRRQPPPSPSCEYTNGGATSSLTIEIQSLDAQKPFVNAPFTPCSVEMQPMRQQPPKCPFPVSVSLLSFQVPYPGDLLRSCCPLDEVQTPKAGKKRDQRAVSPIRVQSSPSILAGAHPRVTGARHSECVGVGALPSWVRFVLARSGSPGPHGCVLLFQDTGVGKSSIVCRFVQDHFDHNISPTIGASFMTKTVPCGNELHKFLIWDTAGQERVRTCCCWLSRESTGFSSGKKPHQIPTFHSLAPMYYRGSAAAVIVYDITKQDSFHTLKKWVKELKEHGPENIVMAIAGNKCDLSDIRSEYDAAHVNTFVCVCEQRETRDVELPVLEESDIVLADPKMMTSEFSEQSK
ncbi:Ras-related protein Rab-31 [Camelus dromedarius]|uniref:Ras-related protein Rab-31 n=1 Tax=Camelus dromedarius TaxID=9838 RepID=A0A5N4CHM2_CAMDR|nr:Ras-related protein Rab-31 [Camelus dromedarius]